VRYTEPEKGLIYADAFFLEAILKYKGLYNYFLDGEEPINIAPVARAGLDRTFTDNDQDGSEIITMDGSQSYDPDGTIVQHVWRINDEVAGTGAHLTDTLPVGIHQVVLQVTDNFGKSGQDTATVTVLADHTGISGSPAGRRVRIFPNPVVDGRFSLDLQGFAGTVPLSIKIMEMTGRTVEAFTVVPLPGNPVQLDLPVLPRGFYLIRLEQGGFMVVEKVIFR
jgi:hypothetical protein